MPTFESYEPGTPCWVDLMSPDPEASKAFYGTVFGWDAEDQFDDDGNRVYVNFLLDGAVVAGMSEQPPPMKGMPALWSTYVCVDDAAAAAQRVEDAGGMVAMPPMQVMDVGHMAVFADPAGAMFSVWQPLAHKGAAVANDPNTWSWNELNTRDIESSLPFYSAVFGWEFDSQDMPMGTYHVIRGGEYGGLGGLMSMPPGVPEQVPNHWMVYFAVTDAAATVEKIQGAGGTIGQEPFAIPGVGTMAVIHDPHMGSFSIMQPEAG